MKALEDRLVDAAEQLIARHGVNGFSLREAARKVRVDPAMVYRHFTDRADLARAVADRGFVRLAERMQRALDAVRRPTPEKRLRVLGEVYVAFALDEPSLFRLMFGPDRGSIREVGTTPLGLVSQCLSELDAEKRLTVKVPEAAAACWAAMHGVAHLLLDGSLERTLPGTGSAAATRMLDVVLRGLGRP